MTRRDLGATAAQVPAHRGRCPGGARSRAGEYKPGGPAAIRDHAFMERFRDQFGTLSLAHAAARRSPCSSGPRA